MSTAQSSFLEAHQQISTGSLTCSDLVDSFLRQIDAYADRRWFAEVYAEQAREQAQAIDEMLTNGEELPPLAGLVLGVKDVIAHAGHGLQAGSRILDGFQSQFTATALQRLLDVGAIVIGRQNCDEFAMGSSNEHSRYGAALHPTDPERVPGGSSGASAAAVAAGCCHASLGSDTGGSVRQPAAFCGTIGFKPSYGRISRWGLIAYASSFDQIGPIAHSVADIATLYGYMAGPDDRDHTLTDRPVGDLDTLLHSQRPLRLGVLSEAMQPEGLDPALLPQFEGQLARLRAAGHTVQELSFPLLPSLVPCYYILTTAEASSNLSRYDGVHYGRRSAEPNDLMDLYLQSRSEGFGEEVQRRILLGSFVLSEGYVDAYFTHAQRVRQQIRQQTLAMFDQVDLILTPTAPTAAFRQGEKLDDPVTMYLSDIFTVHANLVGAPAISLPLGNNAEGLPLAWQAMAAPFDEATLLSFALQAK